MSKKLSTLVGLHAEVPENLDEIIARLSCFASDSSRGYVNKLYEQLALYGLANLPPGFRGIGQIQEQAEKLTGGLQLDYTLIHDALRRLAAQGTVEQRNNKHNKPNTSSDRSSLPSTGIEDNVNDEFIEFRIETQQIEVLTNEYKNYVSFETKVIEGWKTELRQKFPEITEQYLDFLQQDLKSASSRFFSYHSIQNLTLFFGKDKTLNDLLQVLDGVDFLEHLPFRDSVFDAIRKVEIPDFFRSENMERIEYITRQLNSFFILNFMQLDPSCAAFMKQPSSGGKIYLDTNVIYRLLGVASDKSLTKAAIKLIERSQMLGYTTVVATRTLEEYLIKLEIEVSTIKKKIRSLSIPVAKATITSVRNKDFITLYCERFIESEGKLTPDAFHSVYGELSILLGKYNIYIDETFDKSIRSNDAELSREESVLTTSVPEWQPSHPSIVEHDAHMRLLILMLRSGSEDASPLDTKYWLLTTDTKLIKYDRHARPSLGLVVPFCALVTQWSSVINPFAITSQEYDIARAAILDSALLRSFETVSSETVAEILLRFRNSKGTSSEVVAKAILNKTFLRTFASKKTAEERDEAFDDFFYGEFATELEAEAKAKDKRIEELSSQIASLSGQLSSSQSTQHTTQNELSTLTKEIGKLKSERDALNQELEIMKAKASLPKESQPVDNQFYNDRAEVLHDEVSTLRNKVLEIQAESLETGKRILEQDAIIAIQHKRERRNQKIVAVIVVWILCVLLLLLFRPWEQNSYLKWLTLTMIVMPAIITQIFLYWGTKLGKWKLSILIAINGLVAGIAVVLPLGILGITVSDSLGTIIAIVALIPAFVAVFPDKTGIGH